MKKISYDQNCKKELEDLDQLHYHFSAKKSVIDNISCISFISDNIILCGDDQGSLHIFQANTLNRILCQKIFDHTLDKIHGPFQNGFYFLQSQFSHFLKLVQIKVYPQTSCHSEQINIHNNQVQFVVKQTFKFDGAIQFMQKISDTDFSISFKCGQLKFYRFNQQRTNTQEIFSKNSFENLKLISRANEEPFRNSQQNDSFSSHHCYNSFCNQNDDQYFTETYELRFNSPVTHVAKVNSELTVCSTIKELIIINQQKVQYTAKCTIEKLNYIIPFNKDSFLIGNMRGEMQLVCYNKSKKALQNIMNYNLPNTNLLTSLNKYGNRSLIYTSEKGAFIHDLMSHQTICLHSQFSTTTATQPHFDSYSKNIVIADKLSSIHLLSSMKENRVNA